MTDTEQLAAGSAFRICALSLFGLALLRTAWVCDDAFFTFRTIDNLVHGYGLRWNAAERVQAFTHPLWMWLVAALYWVTGEPFFTSIAISIVLTLLTVWLLIRLAPSPWTATIALTVLLFSGAFIDYSTSGLENPLSNVLLVLFFGGYLSGKSRPFVSALLAALIVLTRVDLGLLVLPALLFMLPSRHRGRDRLAFAYGFLPVLVWELFSVVYYGFPFPNTAYAKLMTGLPEREMLQQGFSYLLDSIRRDPISLLAITATTAWAISRNPRGTRRIGIICYVAYVVYVGCDFMSGRMLEAPVLAAAVVLAGADVSRLTEPKWALVLPALIVGLASSHATFSRDAFDPGDGITASGIADERGFYFGINGLLNYSRDGDYPGGHFAVDGRQFGDQGEMVLVDSVQNGMMGYYAGPKVHIMDPMGLGDPLLSRLPARRPWRIGHFLRSAPAGYVASLKSGGNQITDPDLAAYYDRLLLIVRGPLWDGKRLWTIVRMNIGSYDYLLKRASLGS